MSTYRTLLLSATLAISLGFASVFAAAQLERRTSNAGGVAIAVQPLDLAPGAKSWDFEVTMNTHVTPLEQDLTKVSTLVDAAGARQAPTAWKGDPPGGHHRKGVLQFAPLAGSPQYVELQIRDVGAPEVR
ncbi:MAG: hypothetical protein WCA09_14600, partial [Burkholderiales bacterium]